MLCFNCEHRARYLRDKMDMTKRYARRPRVQCGNPRSSVGSCYMFRQVAPLIIAKDESEKQLAKETGVERPMHGPTIISARCGFVRFPAVVPKVKEYKDGVMLYWVPKSKGGQDVLSNDNE